MGIFLGESRPWSLLTRQADPRILSAMVRAYLAVVNSVGEQGTEANTDSLC